MVFLSFGRIIIIYAIHRDWWMIDFLNIWCDNVCSPRVGDLLADNWYYWRYEASVLRNFVRRFCDWAVQTIQFNRLFEHVIFVITGSSNLNGSIELLLPVIIRIIWIIGSIKLNNLNDSVELWFLVDWIIWIVVSIKLNSLNDSMELLFLIDWIIWAVVSIKLNSLNDSIESLLLVDWIIWIIYSIKLNSLNDSIESLLLVDWIIWIIDSIKLNSLNDSIEL